MLLVEDETETLDDAELDCVAIAVFVLDALSDSVPEGELDHDELILPVVDALDDMVGVTDDDLVTDND